MKGGKERKKDWDNEEDKDPSRTIHPIQPFIYAIFSPQDMGKADQDNAPLLQGISPVASLDCCI